MEQTKKSWIVWVVIIIILIVIALVYSNSQKVESGNIKIGWVGPLSGDVATIGQNVKTATELAVSEINNNGGINGRQLQVIYEDGKCDGKEAVTAVTKLINIDNVGVIIGGLCSSETIAPAPIAEKAKVIMISAASSNPSITDAGDYIFRDYPSDSFQGVKAAEFAVNTLKAKNIAVLSCTDDWCQGLQKVFKDKAVALGANIVADEKYDGKTTKDLRTQLTKIKTANADLLYFPSYTDGAVIGLRQAKSIGLIIKVLGGDSWSDPKIVADTGSMSEGIMYLVPSSPNAGSFEADMLKAGKETTIGTREAYDAVKILAQIMKEVGSNSTKIKNALYKVQNYQGISGNISFDKNGDLSSASYDVKTIKNGKAVNY